MAATNPALSIRVPPREGVESRANSHPSREAGDTPSRAKARPSAEPTAPPGAVDHLGVAFKQHRPPLLARSSCRREFAPTDRDGAGAENSSLPGPVRA